MATTQAERDALYIQLLEMLRVIDKKVSDMNDKLIRIEAQDHSKKIEDLEDKFEKHVREHQELKLSHERLTTKISPFFAAISAVGGSALTYALTLIR